MHKMRCVFSIHERKTVNKKCIFNIRRFHEKEYYEPTLGHLKALSIIAMAIIRHGPVLLTEALATDFLRNFSVFLLKRHLAFV